MIYSLVILIFGSSVNARYKYLVHYCKHHTLHCDCSLIVNVSWIPFGMERFSVSSHIRLMLNVLIIVFKHNADYVILLYLRLICNFSPDHITVKWFFMNRKICAYNYEPVYGVVKLETVKDSRGNIFHRVTCSNGEKDNENYLFMNLSSAIDFISSNFR